MRSTSKKLATVVTTLLVSSACFNQALANDEQYLDSDPININGYVTEPAPVTDSELENVKNELRKQKSAIVINKEKKKKYNQLSRSTEKLADVTEDMINERKDSQETIDRFNKKIDCLMAEGKKPGCEEFVKAPKKDVVKVQQAAPVVEAKPVQKPSPYSFGGEVKVMPYTGLTTFMSENENLESGFVGGVRVESNVSDRFSVGLGFNYTSLKTEDFGNLGYYGNNQDFYNFYTSYYGGREIEYSNMKFDLYSKFYLTTTQRFRPYLGAGIGYNRTTLNYNNNNTLPNYSSCNSFNGFNCNAYNFGNEEIINSTVSVDLMVGSEVRFSETIGANLELNYSTGLGSNLSSENGINPFQAPDQQRLEDLSNELSESHIVSLFAGLLIHF